ncbi:MAG: response regulator [Bdellovibrionales bacterium]|nr:response regulator [Bdellovibrionales bacterium]
MMDAKARAKIRETPLKFKRVLLVDDEKEIGEIFGDIFTDLGMDWKYAINGKVALDILSAEGIGGFDLIISDVRMPVMDGHKFLTELKKKHATIPDFIFLTGFADRTPEELMALGARAVYAKPLDLMELEKILRGIPTA